MERGTNKDGLALGMILGWVLSKVLEATGLAYIYPIDKIIFNVQNVGITPWTFIFLAIIITGAILGQKYLLTKTKW